ncbi:Phosphatidylinositol N-acetylglucosaminyltransferase subunit gpi15 [Diplonema papillatum]|nr:Phosphatidylinositol N-acetylglucosaminyltransferase subunit gpi15 [Diplonema papillatum]
MGNQREASGKQAFLVPGQGKTRLACYTRDHGHAKEYSVETGQAQAIQRVLAPCALASAAAVATAGGWSTSVWAAVTCLLACLAALRAAAAPLTQSLLIVRGVGLQLSTASLLSQKTRFVPLDSVASVFINEGFGCFCVQTYLALAADDSTDLLLPFSELSPPAAFVEHVYRDSLSLLRTTQRDDSNAIPT